MNTHAYKSRVDELPGPDLTAAVIAGLAAVVAFLFTLLGS